MTAEEARNFADDQNMGYNDLMVKIRDCAFGGGYTLVVEHKIDDIAKIRLKSVGYKVFYVTYRCRDEEPITITNISWKE